MGAMGLLQGREREGFAVKETGARNYWSLFLTFYQYFISRYLRNEFLGLKKV
jgi:hypothetical protein